LGVAEVIVLDTHVWVWYVSNPEKLSKPAREAIDQEITGRKPLFISSISAWEISMLVSKGRLELTMDVRDWIAKSESIPFFHFVPVDNAVAYKSVFLPEPAHDDPADRIIIATALTQGASLVTKDDKILKLTSVETIW
jgi:PIN domain nuclease of toxin-antitoxin system